MWNIPQVVDLNVQFRHTRVDFLTGGRLAVQQEGSTLRVIVEQTTNDQVGLPLRAFQLNLDVPILLVVLHERLEILCAIEKLETK